MKKLLCVLVMLLSLTIALGEEAFELPADVEIIGAEAFMNVSIDYLEIPEGTRTIAMGAFADCIFLKRVDLPSTLRTVEEDAFAGCNYLTVVVFGGPEAYFGSIYFAPGNEILVGAYLSSKE